MHLIDVDQNWCETKQGMTSIVRGSFWSTSRLTFGTASFYGDEIAVAVVIVVLVVAVALRRGNKEVKGG